MKPDTNSKMGNVKKFIIDAWFYHTSSECGAEKNVHFNLDVIIGSKDDEENPWCGYKDNSKYVRPCLEIAK